MNAQDAANNILVDLDAESQRDLLSNAGTTPSGIAPFHCNNGVDEVFLRSLRTRPTPAVATMAPAPDVDLRNEQQTISRYADDLIVYENQAAELGKRATLANTDFDPLQRKSDDLKGRLSGVQNAVREIVRKLKAANEWDDLTPEQRPGFETPGNGLSSRTAASNNFCRSPRILAVRQTKSAALWTRSAEN